MRALSLLSFTVLLLPACATSSAGSSTPPVSGPISGPSEPAPPPSEPAEPSASASPGVTVAAVQMVGDCPPGSPGSAKRSADAARVAAPNCFDSSMNLLVVGAPDRDQRIELRTIRLRHPSVTPPLAELRSKQPRAWDAEGQYDDWDGTVPAGAERQIMYNISAPHWAAIEEAIGKASDSESFVLEVEIDIDGELQTLTSPPFTRTYRDMVVT